MKTEEYYTREYLYNIGSLETGLRFETDYLNGFTYGRWCSKKKEEDDHVIKAILEHSEVQFGCASEEATKYILQELHNILKNKPSVWRIGYVEPKPGEIGLRLTLKNEDEQLSKQNLIDELLEDAPDVAIDIKYGEPINLDLKCQEPDGESDSYLSVSICYRSETKHVWKKERAYVRTRQIIGGHYYERYFSLRWKTKKRKRIIAEIEEACSSSTPLY